MKAPRSKKVRSEQSHVNMARRISDIIWQLDPKADQELRASLEIVRAEHASKAVVPGNDLYYHTS